MINIFEYLPNLEPYGNPQYFIYLIMALLPISICIFFYGKRIKIYEIIISAIFIGLMFTGNHYHQLIALLFYVFWQYIIICFYSRFRYTRNDTWVFVSMLLMDLLPLVIVKLTPVLDSNHKSFLGFLGISYMMFKSVGIIIEIRDGTLKKINFFEYIRFILFMPTISSGPIDRFRRFNNDFKQVPSKDKYLSMLEVAINNIFKGFLYKFILAYIFGTLLLPSLQRMALQQGGFLNIPTVGVMYTYGLYLFFDFAGYSLFAIAISNIMGIETPINFNKPFMAKNMKDFWNRWHITLSFWFRDYIFMRLVMFLMRNKVFKNRNVTSNVSYLVNMTIMGFWHGITWYYVSYGLFHGCALVINDWWIRTKKKRNLHIRQNKWVDALSIFVTFNIVMLSFLLFSGFLDQLWFNKKM